MPNELVIQVVRLGDPAPFPELRGKIAFEVVPSFATILEGGTTSGASSIYMTCRMKTAVESYVGFQITASMLRSLVAILDGAEANWQETDGRN